MRAVSCLQRRRKLNAACCGCVSAPRGGVSEWVAFAHWLLCCCCGCVSEHVAWCCEWVFDCDWLTEHVAACRAWLVLVLRRTRPDARRYTCQWPVTQCMLWRQRQCSFGGDAEGVKEQLQGIRKRVPLLLNDNVGAIENVFESLRSLCKTNRTRFKRTFMRKWW